MALVKCKQCGHTVSTQAPACPRCGTPPRKGSGGFGSSIGAVAIIVAVGWYFFAPAGSLQRILSSFQTNAQTDNTAADQNVATADPSSSPPEAQAAPAPDAETPTPEVPSTPREAADAYIESLKQQGIVFSSEFERVISYDLSPPQSEVIYNLDYMSQGGGRLVAPYTITVKQTGDEWQVIGGTPGDRTADLNTDPVIGTNGQWQRSPMEQAIGEAMSRGH
jgi:hypothetical protein